MRELDVEIPSQGLIETLRERIAELEDLEARGAATPDSCEILVDPALFIAEGHDEFLYGGLVPGHESAPSLGTAPSSQRMAAESMMGPTTIRNGKREAAAQGTDLSHASLD